MTELGGLVWLVLGLGGLATAAVLLACCLRIRSLTEFLLAAYVLGWALLVALTFALSPLELVTRAWLVAGIAVALGGALAAWLGFERPAPPPIRPAVRSVWRALRGRPALVVLAVAVALGAAYTVALAFFTPVNEGDALAYHLARVAFWKQEHGVEYIANAVDPRLNVNPPNAEIGMLGTMLLSGGERYVALPQLLAYFALSLCVYGLARRIGLGVPEALFGALAFASLPIVVVQASGALNDLVVASFLATAALFALRSDRASLILLAVAIGLAVGTKFTAVLALPTLAFVVALSGQVRRPRHLAAAGACGLALGGIWYVVNVVKTGQFDGGLADYGDQHAEASIASVTTTAMRLLLDLVDVSGGLDPHILLYLVAACVLVGSAGARVRQKDRQARWLAGAGIVTGMVILLPELAELGQRAVYKTWLLLGKPETASWERHFRPVTDADSTTSWFGPAGLLLLVLGAAVVVADQFRVRPSRTALAMALAPWILLLTFALTIVWDPWRGRFLIFGVALAAATWGFLLRHPAVAPAAAAIGGVSIALVLANHLGKPSGLAELWHPSALQLVSTDTIWGTTRAEAQTRLRPETDHEPLYTFIEAQIPPEAHLAIAAVGNDFLSPYFGPRYTRRISLVRSGGVPDEDAEWLVRSPTASVRRCSESWRLMLELESGWRVERRVGEDACLG